MRDPRRNVTTEENNEILVGRRFNLIIPLLSLSFKMQIQICNLLTK